ncbi:MAG: nuclease-related domain-containing protein [Steroidobacteraceae bacterium]
MDELARVPPTTWALLVLAAAVVLALYWAWRWYRYYRARKALRAAVTGGAADHLTNALVPDGMGGGFHVDFLLLTMRGVVVIDLRDVRGNIFGGDQMAEWTVMDGAQRYTFINPQSALYDRIAAVKALAGDIPVEGRIVFTRRGKFPKGLPKFTLMVDALRAEFPPVEYQSQTEATAPLSEGWRRIRDAVKPSYMADMR